NRVHLWDLTVNPPREQAILQGHTFSTRAVTFSPDGKLLAAAGFDHHVRVWDVSGLKPNELLLPKAHLGVVNALAFSPDGQTLASGSDDKTVVLWEVGKDQIRERGTLRVDDKVGRGIRSLAFSGNGKFLVTAGNSVWQMWDMTRKRVVQGGAFNIH